MVWVSVEMVIPNIFRATVNVAEAVFPLVETLLETKE